MNKNIIIKGLIFTIIIIVATITATFAFFSASTENNETINGIAATADLGLEITKITKGSGLIPQLTDYLSSALMGTENDGKDSCIDENGNSVCQVYEATVTNNGSANALLIGKIELVAPSYENLKWEQLETSTSRKSVPNPHAKTDIEFENSLSLAPTKSKTYYFVIWIEENNSVQNETDNGDFTGIISFNYSNGEGVSSTFTSSSTCLSKGTKITMSDGSYKNIENIKVNDEVLTYNHLSGKIEKQKVYYVHNGGEKSEAFTLHFENDDTLSIVGVHDLFSYEELKYVRINKQNAYSFIGKHFYNVKTGSYIKLVNVTKEIEPVEYYSIYTRYNNNAIANNMLSVADDVDWFLNIYDFDEKLKANKETLENDILKYGLYEVNDKELYEDYDLYNLKYKNIIIGKGLATEKELKSVNNDYISNK